MLNLHFVVGVVSVGMMVVGADVVYGQEYPNKPIRIVTGSPGSGNDFTSRQIAPGISGPVGQPVIIDNRSSGVVPAQVVAQAPPDGYTLLVEGTDLWTLPLLRKMPYDLMRDFSPISQIDRSIYIAVVPPSVPVKSIKEFIAMAKARPGEVNYASGSTGGPTHLAAALFTSMASLNMVRVPFKGTGAAVAGLLTDEVQFMIAGVGSVTPHIKSGKLRGLAVTSAEPSALVPWLPTVAASGLPGYEAVSIGGIFAPAKTPAPVIKRLNQEIVRFLNQPDAKEKFLIFGMETITTSPEGFAAAIKADSSRLGKVIKDAGIKLE